MKKSILLFVLFSFLVMGLFGKEWIYKRDCLIHGEKLLLNKKETLEKVGKNDKIKKMEQEREKLMAKMISYFPPKIKKEFLEKVKVLVLKKDKLGEKKFKEEMVKLSRKYFSLYRKYLPRKKGFIKDAINSAKEFAGMVKEFAEMTYNVIMAQAKKKEEMEKEAVPLSVCGNRG